MLPEMIFMDLNRIKLCAGVLGTAVGSSLCNALGGWDALLKYLVFFIMLDYASGMIAAGIEGRLSSRIGYRGVAKKVFILILVAVAFSIDQLIGTDMVRNAVAGFYLGVEGLSILENAGRVGIPLPSILKNTLEILKSKKQEQGK